jgi:hypothetical protein
MVEDAGGRWPSCCSRVAIETRPWASPGGLQLTPQHLTFPQCRSNQVAITLLVTEPTSAWSSAWLA